VGPPPPFPPLRSTLKILLCSHRFSPDIGGIETVSALLANEFARAGHDVRVLTQTREDDGRTWPFQVVRSPSSRELLRHTGWCDVFFQNNVSLQTAWPAFLRRKPWVVAHQTWLGATVGPATWKVRLKRLLLRFAHNIAISPAIAGDIGAPSIVIGNPFDASVFRLLPDVPRDRELVFVGRLVSDKGVDLLLAALGQLASRGSRPRLTVIGTGSEEAALRSQAVTLGIAAQVDFAGMLTGEALARSLNRHRLIVVPSRWAEPFGVVALEGIGCGCVAIGSDQGGLPQAVGPCGVTFPNGDATALAAAVAGLLSDDTRMAQLRSAAPAHVREHSAASIATAYLRIFARAIGGQAADTPAGK